MRASRSRSAVITPHDTVDQRWKLFRRAQLSALLRIRASPAGRGNRALEEDDGQRDAFPRPPLRAVDRVGAKRHHAGGLRIEVELPEQMIAHQRCARPDRKSTRLNSSHSQISYAVFCLKKKKR